MVLLHDFRQNITFAQDLDFLSADFYVVAGVLSVQDFVPLGDGERTADAAVEQFTRADCDDEAALRLLLGTVGEQDASGRFLFRFKGFHDNTTIQRLDFVFFVAHCIFLKQRFPSSQSTIRGLSQQSRFGTDCEQFLTSCPPCLPCRPCRPFHPPFLPSRPCRRRGGRVGRLSYLAVEYRRRAIRSSKASMRRSRRFVEPSA